MNKEDIYILHYDGLSLFVFGEWTGIDLKDDVVDDTLAMLRSFNYIQLKQWISLNGGKIKDRRKGERRRNED